MRRYLMTTGALLFAASQAVYAQTPATQYPTRAVRIIVAVAAGGNVDIVARTFAPHIKAEVAKYARST